MNSDSIIVVLKPVLQNIIRNALPCSSGLSVGKFILIF